MTLSFAGLSHLDRRIGTLECFLKSLLAMHNQHHMHQDFCAGAKFQRPVRSCDQGVAKTTSGWLLSFSCFYPAAVKH